MATSQLEDPRMVARLRKLFRDVLSQEKSIRTSRDAEYFIKAIQAQQPPSTCIESIIAAKSGLEAIRDTVRVDLSTPFLIHHLSSLLRYLSEPGIKALADGQYLRQVLLQIARPPTVWNAFLQLFHSHEIPEDALYPFAWLTHELISLPPSANVDVVADVRAIIESKELMRASSNETREMAYQITKVFHIRCSPDGEGAAGVDGPGGRHDNDFADIRKIAVYPTTDEFHSTRRPFYRRAEEVFKTNVENRAGVHIDNQYRLLREDMLAELREDLQVALGKKKGKRRTPFSIGQLCLLGIDMGGQKRRKKCCLAMQVHKGLEFLQKKDPKARMKYLVDNPSILKHQAFGALCHGDEICGFAFVDRDVDLLVQSPPVALLRFTDLNGLGRALTALKTAGNSTRFVLVDTPIFAYEHILEALKMIADLPLQEALLSPALPDLRDFQPDPCLEALATQLKGATVDMEGTVELVTTLDSGLESQSSSEVRLDQSQRDALVDALTKPIGQIQGPPGTGKSFIGAQLVKSIYGLTSRRILIITYTNHALNQLLENILKLGVPTHDMARLGSKSKCTPSTESILLSEQKSQYRRSQLSWAIVDNLKENSHDAGEMLSKAFSNFMKQSTWEEISDYLIFSADYQHFYDALHIPDDANSGGWRQTGRKGRPIEPDYLFERWTKGEDAGVFRRNMEAHVDVWGLPLSTRRKHVERWRQAMVDEVLDVVKEWVRQFDDIEDKLDDEFAKNTVELLRSKRILGCTTTGAAKYISLIRAFMPDVLIVEEAGEVLESHVLAALAPSTKQLVMIGDHKQLRPKINNYALTVEKGEGFDLNRSLFERRILQGASHVTLRRQHRMAPEISEFPRRLTYPDLLDGSKSMGRPAIRGLRDRVIFVNHAKTEDTDSALGDRRDPGVTSSRTNIFEAEMALKIVKFLGQQGYSSQQMVVLTPYLGQLRLLRDMLQQTNDPQLNDLDNFELVRAGLATKVSAGVNKKPLRLSTIDNYQGEESDIVIVSLTRSNNSGDIGFMAAPERLNVLSTRARNCVIYIGNMATFMNSKKGRDAWCPFFEILKDKCHLYDGLPIRCEKHHEKTVLLQEPADFDKWCPNGGCTEPCGVVLMCGTHKCPSRCHRVSDHSKVQCLEKIDRECERKHKIRIACTRQNEACPDCLQEDRAQERRIKRDLMLEEAGLNRRVAYIKELQDIQDAVEHERKQMRYRAEEEDEKKTLERERANLDALKDAQARQRKMEAWQKRAEAAKKESKGEKAGKRMPDSVDDSADPGSAREEWIHQKQSEGAKSKPLDMLMDMIGLEEVKQQFLTIKSKVDTALLQSVSLASERFSCSMLGNPGTGKTTVARIYAEFLSSISVIPGSCFKETTGASLASNGVQGCKKMLDEILQEGGGVLFIDEAYQLTSGTNPGGGACLDYLLAEVENLTGKVVFVLAGYNKQMESFFSHNPGLPSRFPIQMSFADYTDNELLRILEFKINKKYGGRMECDDGLRGLYCRIVARRVGRGRGKDGFGNARAVENTFARICDRQAVRFRREQRSARKSSDPFFFTKEDLIGPEPSDGLAKCEAWQKLQNLIGLQSVKESVRSLVDTVQQNYHRELAEKPLVEYSLNKVFLGSPGTGKTTVAKLYGQVLVALGMLSKGEVVVKNPSDFVGGVLGQSEQQTKGILASAVGKVLVIDEAYGLYGGAGQDPYKTAVIDTIVAEVQSVPGDDRCVLLLGYRDEMESMFQNVNPGLSRRFPISSAFNFEDFSDDDLRKILDLKLKLLGFKATDQAKNVAMEMLGRARNRPNFGNAGEIDIILNDAKARYEKRRSHGRSKLEETFEAQDFDENFDRAEKAETNLSKLFEGTVGCEGIIEKLDGYRDTVRTMKAIGMDPKENIPFNFLFRGPPGTGKTSTARKMGKVYYDLGFLAADQVEECSATDLIGQYVGQTGPKVQQLLDKALGRVLFIDEAYRLAEGHFAKEAMDEIVDSVTKTKYHKKLIIILAGYEHDINRLMAMNPGLTSRFPETIDFRALTPEECIALLMKRLICSRQKMASKSGGKILDLAAFEPAADGFQHTMLRVFSALIAAENWANARDVQTLESAIFKKALKSQDVHATNRFVVSEALVVAEMEAMLRERQSRSKSAASSSLDPLLQQLRTLSMEPAPPRDSFKTTTATTCTTATAQEKQGATATAQEEKAEEEEEEEAEDVSAEKEEPPRKKKRATYPGRRDAGVSDEIWEQLQRDWQAEQEREEEYERLLEERQRASDQRRDEIVRRLVEEERRREEEARKKKMLEAMGRCPVGFPWIKQEGGYRCAGGSHWLSEAEVREFCSTSGA